MDNFSKIIMKWTSQPDFELLREILAEGPFEQPKVLEWLEWFGKKSLKTLNCEVFSTLYFKGYIKN